MHTFTFYFRLDCEDYHSPEKAGADMASALATAKSALLPLWNHKSRKPIDYARDIAPRITLAVEFSGFDCDLSDPHCVAEWSATVGCDDLALLRDLRRYAADEWNDGRVEEHPISGADEAESDLIYSNYATCAACGFSTDRCVKQPDGRLLCLPCDDHERDQA